MSCSPECWLPILHGVSEITRAEDGSYLLNRVPRKLHPKLNNDIVTRAASPAGTEIRFRLKQGPVKIVLRRQTQKNHPVFTRQSVSAIGLFRGDFQEGWLALQEGDNEIVVEDKELLLDTFQQHRSRFAPELVRLVFSPFIDVRLVTIEGDVEAPRPGDEPPLTLLSYGSSITQGAYAPLGTGTYPAILARELAVDHLNQGFGGGAWLEPAHAEWLVSRRDWHFATAELGANLFHLTPEEFRVKVRDFLAVFERDPEKRVLFVLDLLPNTGAIRGEAKSHAAALRLVVKEEVKRLASSRIIQLHYGDLLPRVADYSLDLLHPGAAAFETLGRALAAQVRALDEAGKLPKTLHFQPLPVSDI